MKQVIMNKEEQILDEHFRYYTEADHHKKILGKMNAEDLQTKQGVQEALDGLHVYLQSEFLLTTASLLSKRFGYFIATGPVAMMTLFDKLPDVSPTNMEYIRLDENEKWLPKLHFKSNYVTTPGEGDRKEWIFKGMVELFKYHVQPLFLHINQLTRLSMDVMWENVVIYLFWFYERKLKEWYEGEELERMKEDFHYLLNDLPGEVFGMRENPLTYFQNQPVMPTESRERKCCCLSYKLHNDSNYCKVCPHLLKNL